MENCEAVFLKIKDRAESRLRGSDSIEGMKFVGTLYPGKNDVRCNLYGILTFRIHTKDHYNLSAIVEPDVVNVTRSPPSIHHWSGIRNMLYFLKYRACQEEDLKTQIEDLQLFLINGLVRIKSSVFPDLEDILIKEKIEKNTESIDVIYLFEKPELIDIDERIRNLYYERIIYV